MQHLNAATSDHSPILLQLDQSSKTRQDQKVFRYEVIWDTHPELKPTIQLAWEPNSHNLSTAAVRVTLNELVRNLGDWSKSSFGSVRTEIRQLKKELERLRSDISRVGPSHAEIKINNRLIELYLRGELMWRQRSRVAWLAEGDRNTHYFHMRASAEKFN